MQCVIKKRVNNQYIKFLHVNKVHCYRRLVCVRDLEDSIFIFFALCGYHCAEEWHFSLRCGRLHDVLFHLMKTENSSCSSHAMQFLYCTQ